jgi:hypothetical protein
MKVAKRAKATRIRVEDKLIDIKKDKSEELEKMLATKAQLGLPAKLQFATEEKMLAGWFRFINATKIVYPNGTEVLVPVKASYLEVGACLRLYLCYPYFDGGTLEHDPSIGLEVVETTAPEAVTPEYIVETPTGKETIIKEIEPIEKLPEVPKEEVVVPEIIASELVIVLASTVSAIAILAFAARRKRKLINVIRLRR